MRNLFGNPEDGTLLAWFADDGIWIVLIVLGAVAGWLVVRHYTRKFLNRAVDTLEEFDMDEPVKARFNLVGFFLESAVTGIVVGIATVLGILAVLGQDIQPALDWLRQVGGNIVGWFASHGVRLVLIVVLGWVAMRLVRRFLPGFVGSITLRGTSAADRDEASKRSDTLSAVFVGVANILIIITIIFTVLTELNVPIGPVLGGFGIAGIAIGFGAQHLVRDLISGVLIIVENQYRQGDVVEIAGKRGLVETINLRRTTIRDLDGIVHTIPNGEITLTSNYTKLWSRIHLDVQVAYKEDMQHVFDVLNRVGEDIAQDAYYGLLIIEPPQVLRVNSFDDSGISIKMLGICKPMTQWEIMGEMRKRIKKTFDDEGIEIPFPHRTVYWGVGAHPGKGSQGTQAVEAPAASTADDIVAAEKLTTEDREAAYREMVLAARAAQARREVEEAAGLTEEQRREAEELDRIDDADE